MKKLFFVWCIVLLSFGACNDDDTQEVVPVPPVDPELPEVPDEPEVEVSEEMKARAEELNAEMNLFFRLVQKPTTATIKFTTLAADEATLEFSDGEVFKIGFDTEITESPLIGIHADPNGQLCWASNIDRHTELLKDAKGQYIAVTKECPTMAVSERGVWTFQTASGTLNLQHADGNFLEATGQEAVRWFQSVTEDDELVKIFLYQGQYLEFSKEREPLPDCSTLVAQLNANMQAASALIGFEGLVARAEQTSDRVTLAAEDGTVLVVPTTDLATELPFVAPAQNGETVCWQLSAVAGKPWLLDGADQPIEVGERMPIMGVDEEGYWTVAFEDADLKADGRCLTRGVREQWRVKDVEGNPIFATAEEQAILLKKVEISDKEVRIVFASDYEKTLLRLFDLKPEMQQRVDETNREINTYKHIFSKQNLMVKDAQIDQEQLHIVFDDDSQAMVMLHASAQMPWFGVREEGDAAVWALLAVQGQPAVMTEEGFPWRVEDVLPVVSVDKLGRWCVGSEQMAQSMLLLDGELEITGAESTPMFKTAYKTDKELVVELVAGGELRYRLKPVITEQMQQRVAEVNVQVAKFAELYALKDAVVSELNIDGQSATLHFVDGRVLELVCQADAGKPMVGPVLRGETMVWALTASEGEPQLRLASGAELRVDGALPHFEIDEWGCWSARCGDEQVLMLDHKGGNIDVTGAESTALFGAVRCDETSEQVIVSLTSGVEFVLPFFVEKAVDLSAEATANTYIVSEEGDYKFKASVRGNGRGSETVTGYDPEIVLAEGMSADWLWMDREDLIREVKFDPASGMISFTASAQKGNAVIALVNGDEVVWTWHIWMTDVPSTMVYPSGAEFMDRNLGALGVTPGSTEAYGMYYQWGRKDPFYGGTTTETSAEGLLQARNMTRVNPRFESLTWSMLKEGATFEQAAAHPMTFYNVKTTNSQDWLKKSKKELWSAEKTLNDPCPAGYKVPEIKAWEGLDSGHNYIDGLTEWSQELYGMNVTQNGQSHWFPAQGSRNYSAGNLIGLGTTRSGNYWSSETAAANARYFYFQKVISRPGSINPDLDKYRSCGYSVRCCKE